MLKSEIEIGPISHRLPNRIRAHASICFIALILYRVMRTRLHASGTGLSPERAVDKLRRIQHHRVTLQRRSCHLSWVAYAPPCWRCRPCVGEIT